MDYKLFVYGRELWRKGCLWGNLGAGVDSEVISQITFLVFICEQPQAVCFETVDL